VAAVLNRNGEVRVAVRKQLGMEEDHMVFEAEVVRCSLAVELIRSEREVKLATIGADSQAALLMARSVKGVEVFPVISYSNLIHSTSLSFSFMLTFILRALE